MAWEAAPSGIRGRQQAYSDAAIQAYFDAEGRVRDGVAADDRVRGELTGTCGARLAGSRFQYTESSPERPRRQHFMPNISGTTTLADRQHWHQSGGRWRVACSQAWPVETASVAEIAHCSQRGNAGDTGRRGYRCRGRRCACGGPPMLAALLSQIPPDQDIATVTADGAYDTRKCHDGIAPCSGPNVGPMRSYRRVEMLNRGSLTRKGPSSEMKRCAPANVLGEPCGNYGLAIIDGPASKPKCTASSYSTTASWHATSTDRLLNCKSALMFSTGLPRLEAPKRSRS